MQRWAMVTMMVAGCGGTAIEGTQTDSSGTGTSSGTTDSTTTQGVPTTGTSIDEPTGMTGMTGTSATGTSTGPDPTTESTTEGTTESVLTGETTVDETTTGTTGDTTGTTGDTTGDTTGETTGTTGDTTGTTGDTTGTTGDTTGTTADTTGTTAESTAESSSTGEDAVCGDGQVDIGESCDDGDDDDTDECTSLCLFAVCGDGLVQAGVDACDDANAVNNDPCSNKCVLTPTGVTTQVGANTAQAGNVNGGVAFNDACPAGSLLIGFQGFLGGSHGRLQGVCGTPGLVPALDGFVVTVSDPTPLPQRGNGGNMQWMRLCPVDQMIVGFSGRAGQLIDQLTFTCAPLVVSEAGDGAWSIAPGPTGTLPAIGGNGGQPFAQANCPAGQVGSMQRIRAGDSVDAFGIGCSAIGLAF